MTLFDPKSLQELGADSNGNTVVLGTLYCDTIADLPAPNAFQGYVLSMGFRAVVIDDNSVHRLNSQGQWIQIVAGNSSYTRAEIDAIINGINEDILSHDITRQGTEIPENADLNDYNTSGAFYSPSSARTSTLANCPWSGSGFKLIIWSISTTSKQQWIMPISTSAHSIIFRNSTSTGWKPWYEIAGVAVP